MHLNERDACHQQAFFFGLDLAIDRAPARPAGVPGLAQAVVQRGELSRWMHEQILPITIYDQR